MSSKKVVIGDKNISNTYKKKNEKEHILDTPDTYIGSIEKVEEPLYIYNEETARITMSNIEYIPGLYKLFDEVIINARDHIVRIITQQNASASASANIKNVSYINVNIDEKTGLIVVENDGNGIDIVQHDEHKVWIPELIFAHLRTSTNYNKEEKRIVGGKNGFGVKLVFIWSTWGKIETADHTRGLLYTQTFERNLDTIGEPVITKLKGGKPFTRISFIPDYARLGLIAGSGGNILSRNIIALLRKRVYDIAGVSDHSVKKVTIRYNDVPISVKNFTQYIEHYIGSEKKVYEQCGDRWEYCVSMCASGEFSQVSFVNGICTYKGGKHVDYLIGQITRKLAEYIEIKKKVKVTAGSIKEQLILFLRCDIENPVFSSQTKDYLDLPSAKFGSLPTVTDAFIEKVAKLGVMATACALTQVKEEKNAKKTDGSKTRIIRGIENLTDANNAGTSRSKECTLLLCEGLSAKAGVISALSSKDRDIIGIYPLKGKVLNVRGESVGKITANKEITELKRILALENGKDYKDVSQLRYGKLMILTDADNDGSHIKGLIVNLFSSLWPSLLKIEGFISFMNTPILRATPKSKREKNKEPLFFYNVGEYNTWLNGGARIEQYQLKYFKGLGTSTAVEFKKYFEDNKYVDFVHTGARSDECIDKVFNKKRPDDRKDWLEKYDKDAFLNTSNTKATFEEFIDNELIHFSNYDCLRSIPCIIDGLKISQRKILYVAFKNNIKDEIKVAQLAAKVSEQSHYNHGEASLVGAIVGMAQDYVGSNNINVLQPLGQFGTRLQNGQDHASERYIFTALSGITRKLFKELDEPVLDYLNEDGYSIEPQFYMPILPFILINSCRGIGTGFSTSILPMNPLDIVHYIRSKLVGDVNPIEEFFPYFEGYRGTITKLSRNRYLVKGVYTVEGDTVKITELPIEVATETYKQMLDDMAQPSTDKNDKKVAPIIKDFVDMSTDKIVNITVQFAKGEVDKLSASVDTSGINGLEKLLKLTTTISNTNMYLFKEDLKLHKYESVEEIINYFMEVRLKYYGIRKNYMIDDLNRQLMRLTNKARFITMCLEGTIDLRRKTNDAIDELMEEFQFDTIDDSYDYLIKIPMNSVSRENAERILKEEMDKREELRVLIGTSLEKIWIGELDDFKTEYAKYKKEREIIQNGVTTIVKKMSKK
jgi:DNA topoisomerase-2